MDARIVLAVLPGVVRAHPAGLCRHLKGRLAYRVTDLGTSTALFYLHAYDAVVGQGLADICADIATAAEPIKTAMGTCQQALRRHMEEALGQVA